MLASPAGVRVMRNGHWFEPGQPVASSDAYGCGLASAFGRSVAPGNNDAVCPSPPMPSTARQAGSACLACRLAVCTHSGSCLPGRTSGMKVAADAWVRKL